jgi:hypothetical protein
VRCWPSAAVMGLTSLTEMVFAHRISAMEAYLGDTMINSVQADSAAFGRLLTLNKDLEKEKFTLAEIHASPNFVNSKVRAYLRSLMWHNLPKADVLYKLVLGINLFAMIGEAKTALLLKAVEYRHDCVHRNGYDKDGNRLQVFGLEYVAEVGHAVHEDGRGSSKDALPAWTELKTVQETRNSPTISIMQLEVGVFRPSNELSQRGRICASNYRVKSMA